MNCSYPIATSSQSESSIFLPAEWEGEHGDLAEEINYIRENRKFGWHTAEMLSIRLHKDATASRHLCYFNWLNPEKANVIA